ncbi:replication-associated recombination protein A [bacterium]|nr:MAG: replication-associated recombination protein A [bacterium]
MEPIAPLAARMRPRNLDEFLGQKHLVGPGAAFRRLVESDRLGSVLLWGPPGVGKTTLAEIVARTTGANFIRVSAVSAGVADLRKAVEEAREARQPSGGLFAPSPRRTILFIDEIHRFNKAQQDAVLPHVESGLLTLIGATTENPSFEVNAALLSRARVYTLNALTDDEIGETIDSALNDEERGLPGVTIEPDAKQALVTLANGDARAALTMLEATASVNANIDLDTLKSTVQRRVVNYDKSGEQHFDLISALHKCVRDSDPDASLYWLARMLEGGEDPMYLARRIVRMATEDIGLGDPRALQLCVAAQQAVHFIGMPEGGLALAEAIVYLALAPKSNAVYTAYKAAWADVEETRNDPVPLHLRNAPTRLMTELGYGAGYQYAHDAPDAKVEQQHLPDALVGRVYYQPTDRGFERKFRPDVDTSGTE